MSAIIFLLAVVYTNADLTPLPTVSEPPNLAEQTVAVQEIAPLTYETFRDRNGHDQSWWRTRTARLDAEFQAAEERLEAIETMLLICRPRFPRRDFCTRNVHLDLMIDFEEAQNHAKQLQLDRKQLREDARRADALPGWFR